MQRILTAIDLTEASRQVLRMGLEVSKAFGARLNVIHVIPTLPYDFQFPGIGGLLGANRPEIEIELCDIISGVVKDVGDESVQFVQNVLEGSVDELILKEAALWDASLIVVGSQSGPASQTPFLGSVAIRVMTHAPTQVLVVREDHVTGLPASILAAVDGSQASEPVLRTAALWSRRLARPVSVVHVEEDLAERIHEKLSTKPELEAKLKEFTADSRERVDALVRSAFTNGQLPTVRHRTGRPYAEICAEAAEGRFGLVIVGRHGWSSNPKLGNTAARIAHASPCSVLAVEQQTRIESGPPERPRKRTETPE